jgi:hypothetical protein
MNEIYTEEELNLIINNTIKLPLSKIKNYNISHKRTLSYLYKKYKLYIRFTDDEIKNNKYYDDYHDIYINRCSLSFKKISIPHIVLKNYNEEAHKSYTIKIYAEIISEFQQGKLHVNYSMSLRNHIELIPLLDEWVKKNTKYNIKYTLIRYLDWQTKIYEELTEDDIYEFKQSHIGRYWHFKTFDLY